MATPASCPLCGGSFPSKNAMFKHLRDENVETAGLCGSWCVKHGGVAEAARKIAAGELEAGRLIKPFDLSFPVEFAYYLVFEPSRAGDPRVVAFRDWLLKEVNESLAEG